MTPQSAEKDISKALEYITGAPQGAGLGKQMELYRDMLARQVDTSRDIIAGELGPAIANSRHLRKKDQERYDAILSEAGIAVDDKGSVMAYQPKYESRNPKADEVVKGDGATAIAAPATPPLSDIEAEMAKRKLKPKGK